MRKRKISLFILATMLVASLTGCSSKEQSKGENVDTENSSKKKVEVTYALWANDQAEVYEELAKEFESQNPNIDIKIELTPWAQYWTKIETSAIGGSAPDVFWLNIPKSYDYMADGVLLPLDDLNIELDKLPERSVDAFKLDGNLYGVPKDIDTNAIWYNKTIFDEAKVEYPNDNWTWDDLMKAAEKLTNTEKGIYGMAAPITWQGGYYETILQNEGIIFTEDGKKSGFDNSNTIAAVEYWHEFIKKGYSPSVEQLATTSNTDYLLNGKVAMCISGAYLEYFLGEDFGKENLDVAPMPKGKVRATTSNSLANVVYSKTDNPEESKKWVEFLATKEANEFVAKSGVALPTYEGTQELWANKYPDKNLKVFIDAIDYAVPLPNIKNGSSATSIEQEILLKGWMGQSSIEDACLKVAEEANKLLAK